MGKVCTVSGCPSGRRPDEVRRERAGIRRASLFSVPKQADLLNKWSRALGKNLTAKDLVCELHFSPECIVTEDITVMPDGSLHRIPREKYKLTIGAVPISVANQKNEVEITLVDALPKESMDVEFTIDIEGCAVTDFNDLQLQVEGVDGNSECNEVAVLVNAVLAEDKEPAAEATQFSFNNIVQYFQRTPLRQAWCWMQKMQNDHCIILTQINPCALKIRLVLKIHWNLSVTAHTSDDKVTVEFRGLITSARKIEQLLDTMEKKVIVCNGTGMEKKSRADDCSGFMSTTYFKRFVQMPRCDECAQLRRNLRRHRKINMTDRYSRVKLELKLSKRKIERLRKKVACRRNVPQ